MNNARSTLHIGTKSDVACPFVTGGYGLQVSLFDKVKNRGDAQPRLMNLHSAYSVESTTNK